MLFLKYSMMEKLNLDFVTIPGKDAYESGSTPVRDFFFIAIIAEGKEECIDVVWLGVSAGKGFMPFHK